MKYNPALDGLRAIAVLLVVAVHTHVPGLAGGYVGVEIFFVLSGYLITSILLAEHERTGRIAIGAFYWRRALRLYPALLLLLAAYLALAPLAWPGKPHGRDALITGLYLSDYAVSFWNVPQYLSHTWSLAAEEHFYLLWPLLLVAMLRKPLPQACRYVALLTVAAWLWQVYNMTQGTMGFRFDTRAVGMFAGCWLAFAMRLGSLKRTRPDMAAAVGVALLVPLMFAETRFPLPLAELAGACLIVGAAHLPLTHPALVWLGKLSYGVYLWHFPLAKAINPLLPWPAGLAVVFVLSVGAAWVSFNTVEVVARRYRHLSSSCIPDSSPLAP